MFLFGSNFANNSIYTCGPSCVCDQTSPAVWDSPTIFMQGINCVDTVYMNTGNSYVIPEFPVGWVTPYSTQTGVIQNAYQNLTNIAGFISANLEFVGSYFGQE